MKKIKIIGLLLICIALSNQAVADVNFRSYHDGRFDFDASVNYFKTTSNFSSGGVKADLPSGYYLQTIDTTAQARYVLTDDFGIFAGGNVAVVESADSLSVRSNSILNKIFIGADFQFYNSSVLNFTGEVSYLQNLENIKADTDTVIGSDGANEITALVGSVFNFDWVYPFLKGGIKYRTEGLSTLFVYTVGLETRNDDIALGGLLNGFSSIKDDDKTSVAYQREIITNRVNAFSKKYDSINPSVLDLEVYLKYNFTRNFEAKIFGGYALIGTNTAQGIHGGGSIGWGFGGDDSLHSYHKNTETRKVVPTKKVTPTTPGFKEDTNDGVNQDYFKPVTPSEQLYVEPSEAPPKSYKKNSAPRSKVTDPTAAPSEGEYTIKLKKNKKKKAVPIRKSDD